jgi:hypothetical protein
MTFLVPSHTDFPQFLIDRRKKLLKTFRMKSGEGDAIILMANRFCFLAAQFVFFIEDP